MRDHSTKRRMSPTRKLRLQRSIAWLCFVTVGIGSVVHEVFVR